MKGPPHMQEIYQGDEIRPHITQSSDNVIDLGTIQTDPRIDYAEWTSSGKGLKSFARVTEDGRIVISLELTQKLPDLPSDYARDVEEFAVDELGWKRYPSMSIVIMIVGSRGDVQPYVALGQRLSNDGHRVRIATHSTFNSFVTESGLEFFDIGGNPQDLMSYMVKNPGLIPGFTSLTNGDIGRKRKMLAERCLGKVVLLAQKVPSHALNSPRSPTGAFPHPLVNIKQSNAEHDLTNYLSYAVADLLTWQGIGDLVNTLRTQSLGLNPLGLRSGPGLVDRLKVPWTYCMSPALVPKPQDWKNHIGLYFVQNFTKRYLRLHDSDVVGFYFLDLATNFTPADDLAAFLAAGEPPVYIGYEF
ncbi:hypothetical protein H0H81_001740 [Sphagnurus paluster]|uniref:Glycosyltransferase family 28 N-terminal domain-containing protein n=1 Tax=Sphagnurus paluster TaxID=117069 RepID=A0A9P7FTE8_9AGAR|nr:hypothetical protein H0H81_001740 [Sphagnurus paluster]